MRPETFECPWCGPNGVEVDRTLPIALRRCDACSAPDVPATPKIPTVNPAVTSLRAILASHVRDLHKPWPGCDFGKSVIGNALLGALESYGCDRGAELARALASAKATA